MTRDRFDDDDELNFDDDEFVLDDDSGQDDVTPTPDADDLFEDGGPSGDDWPGGKEYDLFGSSTPPPTEADAGDDDFMVIAPDDEPVLATGGGGLGGLFDPGRAAAAALQATDGPEDVLFDPDADPLSEDSQFGANMGPPFDEVGKGKWAGSNVSFDGIVGDEQFDEAPEDQSVGFEEEDPFAVDDVELELIDGDYVGQEADADGGIYAGVGAAPDATGDWAPDEDAGQDEDAIYGDGAGQADGEDEAAQAGYEEADYGEYEESFVDAGADASGRRVVGTGGGRRWPVRMVAAAAVLLIAAGGAVTVLKPEWLGLQTKPELVDRIEIARPTIRLDLGPPEVDLGPVPIVVEDPLDPGVDPVTTDPPPDPPVLVPPTVIDPPVGPVVIGPDPIGHDPIGPDPVRDPDVPVVVAPPTGPDAGQPDELDFDSVPVGDNLVLSVSAPYEFTDSPYPDLVPGIRAFAQLENDAFFIGTVKRLDATSVTLRLETGEVSLVYSELRSLEPLTHDQNEIVEARHGFVRLTNQARLFGTILRSADTDTIVLQTDDSRVTIPRHSIDRTGSATAGGVQVVEDEDDDWVQQKADERLQTRSRGIRTTIPIVDPPTQPAQPTPIPPTPPMPPGGR